ncbi:MAG: hypothetical protein V4549_09090, partial [Bacteroidota bacterium]
MVRKIILLFILLFFCANGYAQYLSNSHTKQLTIIGDTNQLDTLSLVPGSIKIITNNGTELDTSFYKINYAEGLLILNLSAFVKNNIVADRLNVSYKTFPYLFSAEVKHKDLNRIKPDLFGNINPFSYTIESKSDDIFKMEG